MVETLQRSGLWHIILVEKDLVDQAGLDKKDFEKDFGYFKYKNKTVIISHIFNNHLVVSIKGKDDEIAKELVKGLSKVVEYNPFCKYDIIHKMKDKTISVPTYEWDKVNSNKRYRELLSKENISNLTTL